MSALRVVAAVLIHDHHILLGLRGPKMTRPGHWELPGGKVEPGETDQAALARELREELDVEVTVGERLGEARRPLDGRTLVLVAYRCTLAAGEPRPLEHAELAWVPPDELAEYALAPADRDLVAVATAAVRG